MSNTYIHLKKYNWWWANNMRRMKKSMRNRLQWTEDQWIANVNHCCLFMWVYNQAKQDDGVTQDMLDSMESAFICGHLAGAQCSSRN